MTAITSNYIFASLNAQDLNNLAMSMEIVDVSAGENIITQGAYISFSPHVPLIWPINLVHVQLLVDKLS